MFYVIACIETVGSSHMTLSHLFIYTICFVSVAQFSYKINMD